MVLVETRDVLFFERAYEINSYKFRCHSLFTLMCVCSTDSGDFEAAMLKGKSVRREHFPRESFADPE